ncbi:MAG: hypothetical protein CSA20_04435 [Deltaproteobacteria bacterium]|nr:MAG: hypothetical protein CSA20_04435 [Deltaproteobacteria bacterium]
MVYHMSTIRHSKEGIMALALRQGPELTITEIIEKIENGVPTAVFNAIKDALELSDKELAQTIRIPRSTLALRKRRGRFSYEESERLYRLQRLIEKAVQVFGDIETARIWLKNRAYGLGDRSPLAFCRTEIGAREVENLLGRIEYGVFS